MSRNGKVVVAMSGGVDSSVAAALLKEQGYECVGVFMRVGVEREEPGACQVQPQNQQVNADTASPGGLPTLPAKPAAHRHGCCSASDALDARSIAGKLGIPFYALNFRADFDRIIDYFVDEYRKGRTPNPCVMCNIHLKFGKLLRYADMVDAQFVATGHYARIVRTPEPRLARAGNVSKDQSYVLFGIRRHELERCLFPLGDVTDKAQVREMAAALGLRVYDKPDSQEICFVPNNDYRELLSERAPETNRAGELRDVDGRALGTHDGVSHYTIGQRRGLGIAIGMPLYVTSLDAESNTVTVGPREMLLRRSLIAEEINWHADATTVPNGAPGRACRVKIRHTHCPAPAKVYRLAGDAVRVDFDEPQAAITPGQAAVFYDNDVIIGGGWIRDAAD